jgi:hypothetical protein
VKRVGVGLLAVAMSGCGPATAPPPLHPAPPSEAELAAKVTETYRAWEKGPLPKDCSVYFATCADAFARQAGFDPQDLSAKNPRAFMQSPDPRWIPGWAQIPTDQGRRHVTFGALARAAAMKHFFTNCQKDFDAVDLTRAEETERLGRELEAIDKLENPYARLGRLVTYRRELKQRFNDPVGPRYALELAVYERFSKAGRGFLYELQNQRSEDAAAFRPAFTTDEERDLFCMSEHIPTWQDAGELAEAYVFNPIAAERQKALLEKAKSAQDLEGRLPAAERKLVEVGAALPEKGARIFIGKEVIGVPLTVTQVKEGKDGVLVMDLAGGVDGLKVAACKTTDKIEKIVEGKPVYEQECKPQFENREVGVRVRLVQRPDVAINKGDVVTVLGTVTKTELRTSKQGSVSHVARKLEIDAVHIFEIWRERLLVADYFVQ